jgi:hypothetical protein
VEKRHDVLSKAWSVQLRYVLAKYVPGSRHSSSGTTSSSSSIHQQESPTRLPVGCPVFALRLCHLTLPLPVYIILKHSISPGC